jgi:hypothetical protein
VVVQDIVASHPEYCTEGSETKVIVKHPEGSLDEIIPPPQLDIGELNPP